MMAYGGFPPEQQELLSRRHLIVVDRDGWLAACTLRVVHDASLEEDKGDGRDTCSGGFEGAEAPFVFAVEATTIAVSTLLLQRHGWGRTNLMQSMSMRCCSARLFSLFTFLCNAVKMLFFSIKNIPHCLLISNKCSFANPFESVPTFPSFGAMEKYSSSSRRTMMACFERRGFWDCGLMEE